MLSYNAVSNKPRVLQSLTGLNLLEFEQGLKSFEPAWFAYVEKHHIQGKMRQRRYGAGRKSQLDRIEDQLLFILVYYRLYPTQAVQGFLFGIGQPQAHEWVHKLRNRTAHYVDDVMETACWAAQLSPHPSSIGKGLS